MGVNVAFIADSNADYDSMLLDKCVHIIDYSHEDLVQKLDDLKCSLNKDIPVDSLFSDAWKSNLKNFFVVN